MSETGVELVLVAALDREHAIGKGNTLPWHLPDDLKRFKALTLGKPLLMGRKTSESLGRALPGRRNLVLTRSGRVPFDGMEAVASIEAALTCATEAGEVCVIGGGEVYALALPHATRLHLRPEREHDREDCDPPPALQGTRHGALRDVAASIWVMPRWVT